MKHREGMNDMPEENEQVEREAAPVEQDAAPSEASSLEATRRWRADSRRRLILIASAVLLLVLVIVVLVWRSRRNTVTTADAAEPVVSVRVAKAEKQTIAAQVSALGTVFPRDTAQVSAKISAQIKQMPLLKNRPVRAGDVVAVLESRDLQAQRGEAAAALNEARANARSVETGTIPQNNAQDQKALRDARSKGRHLEERFGSFTV
jgi:multidrug efflux pump subunit AcrA (membrane-fusion protein)